MKSTAIASIQHRRTSVIKEVPPQFHVHQQDVGTLVRIQDNWCEHEAVLVNVEDGDSLKLSKKLFLQECTDTTAPTLDDATQIFIILIRKTKFTLHVGCDTCLSSVGLSPSSIASISMINPQPPPSPRVHAVSSEPAKAARPTVGSSSSCATAGQKRGRSHCTVEDAPRQQLPNAVAGRAVKDSAEKLRTDVAGQSLEKKVPKAGPSPPIPFTPQQEKQRLGVGLLMKAMQKHRYLMKKRLQQPAATMKKGHADTDVLMALLAEEHDTEDDSGGIAPASPLKPGAAHEPEGDGSIQVAPPPPA